MPRKKNDVEETRRLVEEDPLALIAHNIHLRRARFLKDTDGGKELPAKRGKPEDRNMAQLEEAVIRYHRLKKWLAKKEETGEVDPLSEDADPSLSADAAKAAARMFGPLEEEPDGEGDGD